jgi:hypothetical protein
MLASLLITRFTHYPPALPIARLLKLPIIRLPYVDKVYHASGLDMTCSEIAGISPQFFNPEHGPPAELYAFEFVHTL